VLVAQPTGDLLGRPVARQVRADIAVDVGTGHFAGQRSVTAALIGQALRGQRRIRGRGAVVAQLAADGAAMAAQLAGDLRLTGAWRPARAGGIDVRVPLR